MKKIAEPNCALLRVLKHEVVRPAPVWLMRQAGRYLPEYRALRAKAGDFWTLCSTPELAAEVTLQPIQRFDLDAAIVFSDILTIPSALGQAVRIEDGTGPRLAEFPGVARLIDDSAQVQNALRPVYDALGIVRRELSPSKALVGFAGAPWTLATYMLGGNGTPEKRQARAKHSPVLPDLLSLLAKWIARHLGNQLSAGSDVVQVFDSWAGGLSDTEFETLVVAPTKALVSQLRVHTPSALVIGFPRGATQGQYARYVAETRVNGLSLHTELPLEWATAHLNNVTLQGNLDPIVLVEGGDRLDRSIDAILNMTLRVPFIFNLGHGVVPETPPEHVAQLVKRVRGFVPS